jgi:hypothetical protein
MLLYLGAGVGTIAVEGPTTQFKPTLNNLTDLLADENGV